MLDIREYNEGVMFSVIVQPRSKKNEIVGIHGGALRVKVTAPPVEDAANKALRKLLSRTLGASKSSIDIIKGRTSPRKLIHCRNLNLKEWEVVFRKIGLQ